MHSHQREPSWTTAGHASRSDLTRPERGGGPEGLLGRRPSLTEGLQAAVGLRTGETVKRQEWGRMRTFQGMVYVYVGKEVEGKQMERQEPYRLGGWV